MRAAPGINYSHIMGSYWGTPRPAGCRRVRPLGHRLGLRREVLGALGLALVVGTGTVPAAAADEDIRISSIGYGPSRSKVASVLNGGTRFELRDALSDEVVFEGELSAEVMDAGTGDSVRFADFSGVQTAGEYVVSVPGVGRSISFPIHDAVYFNHLGTAMLGFYGWRSGMKVEISYGGQQFQQGPGHGQDGLLDYLGSVGEIRDGSRGWYDAGDYGKYTVNAGITLGMMLAAWEQFRPQLEAMKLPIAEQGGLRPDYLDEIAWEYDWLFSMQYSATDGRVSHKLTSIEFADFVLPEADIAPTYYSAYGTAATASFVASMAKGTRAFQPYDADYAERMQIAARLSYDWLVANPANVPASISQFKTGGYGTTDGDDRLWAAAEMWETTGEAALLADLETRIRGEQDKVDADFDWSDVSNLGVYTYVLSEREGRDPALLAEVKTALVKVADQLVSNRAKSGYGRALTGYYWGVNGSVARSCMTLVAANRVSPNPDYLGTCADQVAHLYGRNTFNRSFVTGEGKDPPLHPHHRPSAGDTVAAPFPGLLVGGPNADRQCPTTVAAAKNWNDTLEDYCTNEVAINWNGALVYALAAATDPAFLPPADSEGAGGQSGTPTGGFGGRTTLPIAGAGNRPAVSGGGSESQAPPRPGTLPVSSGGQAGSGGGSAVPTPAAAPGADSSSCGCHAAGANPASKGILNALTFGLLLAVLRRAGRKLRGRNNRG